MSDTAPLSPVPTATVHEDRVMPAIVYALYLVGFAHLTAVVGLLVAYACRGGAGPVASSHYTYQIRTFWLTIWWLVVGVVLCIVGAVLSVILIGIPIVIAGAAICSFVWLYIIVRAIVGAFYLGQGVAHPRPEAWLF